MTQPAGDGAPGAQADATATDTATGTATAQGLDPNEPIDFDSLPPNVKKHIADLRKESGSHRQGKSAAEKAAAEATRQRNEVLKALGLNADGSTATDPQAAVNQLTQRATAAETAAWGAIVKLEVHEAAADLGANAKKLLNSISFVDSLDDLVDEDPGSPEFRTALEAKIRAAVKADSTLAAGKSAGKSGGEFNGGSGAGTPITEEQLARMNPDEITKAFGEGKLKHLL